MKKLVVTIHTFERWKVDKDLAMNATMWLTYDKMTTNHECVDVYLSVCGAQGSQCTSSSLSASEDGPCGSGAYTFDLD